MVVWMCVCMVVCVYGCMCVCICMRVCVFVCVYVYMCVAEEDIHENVHLLLKAGAKASEAIARAAWTSLSIWSLALLMKAVPPKVCSVVFVARLILRGCSCLLACVVYVVVCVWCV
jgi:hypothetical protein